MNFLAVVLCAVSTAASVLWGENKSPSAHFLLGFLSGCAVMLI